MSPVQIKDPKQWYLLPQIPSDKLVKLLNILEKNIQDGAKLSTLMNHVSSTSPSLFLY